MTCLIVSTLRMGDKSKNWRMRKMMRVKCKHRKRDLTLEIFHGLRRCKSSDVSDECVQQLSIASLGETRPADRRHRPAWARPWKCCCTSNEQARKTLPCNTITRDETSMGKPSKSRRSTRWRRALSQTSYGQIILCCC